LGSGGSIFARKELKGIDGRAPQGVEIAAQFDPTRENLPGPEDRRRVSLKSLLDLSVGGAWPFLVGVVKCLVDSVNERDLRKIVGDSEGFRWGEGAGVVGGGETLCW